MKQRSTYQKPTLKVVEVKTGGVLLEGSPVNTTLGGYTFIPDGTPGGWVDE